MTSIRTARHSLVVLLFAAAALLAVVIWSMATALFLAAVLAGLLWPLQQRCAQLLNGSRSRSAVLLVIATTILVVLPLAALSLTVVRDGAKSVAFVSRTLEQSGVEGLLRRLPKPVSRVVLDGLRWLPTQGSKDIDGTIQRSLNGEGAVAVVGAAISATGSLAFQTVLMMIALYFFLYRGDEFVSWVDENAPLERGQTRALLAEVCGVSSAVVTSTIVTAAAQAAAALAGYLIAGVPHPMFVAAMTFFFAFIPAVGAGTACLAVSAIMALAGHPYPALFLAIWGLVVVGLTDNVVRPLLVQQGAGMHGGVVFFAIIGGLGAFGAVGLLLGPLIVALFLAVLRMHRRAATWQRGPAHPSRFPRANAAVRPARI